MVPCCCRGCISSISYVLWGVRGVRGVRRLYFTSFEYCETKSSATTVYPVRVKLVSTWHEDLAKSEHLYRMFFRLYVNVGIYIAGVLLCGFGTKLKIFPEVTELISFVMAKYIHLCRFCSAYSSHLASNIM